MLQIRIDQQFAQIGLKIQKPVLNLETALPAVRMNIEEPRLKIDSPQPVLHIDQTQCFADAGKRIPSAFAGYCSDLARNDLTAGIDRIVQEGNYLGEIENGGTIAQLAADSMAESVDFNVTAIPKQRPDISFDVYPVKVQLDRGTVDLQLQQGRVDGNLQWGKVNTYIAQKNFIKISWTPIKVNTVA